MHITDVIIDPEFANFLPPISAEELAALRASVEAHGFTDPIIVWMHHGELVDGFHRYRLWRDLGWSADRAPDIVERKFPDRAAVMSWMFERQAARRNWTPAQKAAVGLKMKPAIEQRAKANQKAGGGTKNPEKQGEKALLLHVAKARSPVHTRDEIAKAAGVSSETVRKTEVVLNEGAPEVKQALLSGQMSARQAFSQTRAVSRGTTAGPSEIEDGPDRTNPESEKQIAHAARLLARLFADFGRVHNALGPLVCAFDAIKAADPKFGNRHRALLGHHKRLFDAMSDAKEALDALKAAWVRK